MSIFTETPGPVSVQVTRPDGQGQLPRTMHMFAQMSMDDALKFSKAKALKGTREPVKEIKRRRSW